MIFYFSGTGNSYAAAKILAEELGESLQDIGAAMRKKEWQYTLQAGERLGFVFPVYAWAPPQVVMDFVKKCSLTYPEQPYTFAVCTCGGAAGNAMERFEIALEEGGLSLNSGFSLIMPNNCVTLFEVDSPEEEAQKLAEAEQTLRHITRAIQLGKTDFFRIRRGKHADLMTTFVSPFQKGFGSRTKPFYVTGDCIGCGLCETICTSGCIQMAGSRPIWMADHCNMCLACLNRCPARAIQYGKKTETRGRYVHPLYRIKKEGESTE